MNCFLLLSMKFKVCKQIQMNVRKDQWIIIFNIDLKNDEQLISILLIVCLYLILLRVTALLFKHASLSFTFNILAVSQDS